jgi:amino acid transporter
MVMDYMLNPLICTIWCAQQANAFAPGVPVVVWKIFFAGIVTVLNLRGVKTSARINAGMAAGMGAVITVFFVAAARYICGHPHDPAFFTRPFYDPQTFSTSAVFGCTSIAVLTYIGFDGISTLSEEAENPKRNILLATVLVCLITGVLASIEVYVAQLVWPSSQPFPDVDTAYVSVAGRAAGHWLFSLINVTLLVATVGSGMGSQLGAARLLYGMGRGNAIPKSFFGALEPKRRIPRNNVLFVGVFALIGTTFLTFERAAELLNFGALLAFMGVNAASFTRYFLHERKRDWSSFLVPTLGFSVCFLLWLNLSHPAKIAGVIWMFVGIGYGAIRTRGFKADLVSFEIPDEETNSNLP